MKPTRLLFAAVGLSFALPLGCAAKSKPEPIAPPAPVASSAPVAVAPPPARPDTPDADFRKQPPDVGKRRKGKPLAVSEGKLKNGARVLVVEIHDVPTVSFQAVMTWPDKTSTLTVPELAQALRGRKVEGEDFEARIERISGSTPHFEVTKDSLHIATNTTPEVLDRVFKTMAAALRPLDTKEVESLRRPPVPAEPVQELAFEKLLKPESPYRTRLAIPITVHPKSPPAADVARLLATSATGANMIFVATGDTTVAELVPKLDAAFGSLPEGKAAGSPVNALTPGKLVVLDDKGMGERSQIALVADAPPRGHKDYPAVQIASYLLGERLLTRGVFASMPFSRLDASRLSSLWIVSTTVPTVGVESSIERLLATAGGIGTVGEDELEKAKRPWIEWTETMLERKTDIGWSVARSAVQGMSLGEMADLQAAFVAVTAADVARVAKERLDKKSVSVAVVGAHDKMKGLDKLGLGRPTVFAKPSAVVDKLKAGEPADVIGKLRAK